MRLSETLNLDSCQGRAGCRGGDGALSEQAGVDDHHDADRDEHPPGTSQRPKCLSAVMTRRLLPSHQAIAHQAATMTRKTSTISKSSPKSLVRQQGRVHAQVVRAVGDAQRRDRPESAREHRLVFGAVAGSRRSIPRHPGPTGRNRPGRPSAAARRPGPAPMTMLPATSRP